MYNKKHDTRFIEDRWLNKDYRYIAIWCKGRWTYYIRMDEVDDI